MAKEKEYFIRVRGTPVTVTQEVYQACHQTKRYAKTLYEKDVRHNLVSYDGMDAENTLGVETISDTAAPSVEDIVIDKMYREKLRLCLSQLTEPEWSLIHALFYEQKSERECAEILDISQSAVNKRRHKILAKLRRLIKI